MVRLALNIFKSFFMLTLCLLLFVLAFSIVYSHSSGIFGVILGWSGMEVYLFWITKSMARIVESGSLSDIKPRPQGPTFFRFIFLLFFLTLAAGKGMVTFFWTVGTAFLVYFSWIIFLIYRFYKT